MRAWAGVYALDTFRQRCGGGKQNVRWTNSKVHVQPKHLSAPQAELQARPVLIAYATLAISRILVLQRGNRY